MTILYGSTGETPNKKLKGTKNMNKQDAIEQIKKWTVEVETSSMTSDELHEVEKYIPSSDWWIPGILHEREVLRRSLLTEEQRQEEDRIAEEQRKIKLEEMKIRSKEKKEKARLLRLERQEQEKSQIEEIFKSEYDGKYKKELTRFWKLVEKEEDARYEDKEYENEDLDDYRKMLRNKGCRLLFF
jgi:hypothetical protein